MKSLARWFWDLPSRIAGLGTWAVLRSVAFCAALSIVLPIGETYLAAWIRGSRFMQATMLLVYGKLASFFVFFGSMAPERAHPILPVLSQQDLMLANGWAWVILGSIVIPMGLIVALLVVYHTWNSVSTWLDLVPPLTKNRRGVP